MDTTNTVGAFLTTFSRKLVCDFTDIVKSPVTKLIAEARSEKSLPKENPVVGLILQYICSYYPQAYLPKIHYFQCAEIA